MDRRSFLASLATSSGLALWGRPAHAQSYPLRPVRVVVPYSAGGTTDFTGRVVAEKMGELAGHNFVVENKTGAASVIGLKDVAGATPDGYSILFTDSTLSVLPTSNPGARIDPLAMFKPIGLCGVFPSVMVVHPSVKANTVAELVELAKANPGQFNFGSGGVGTVPHLQGEQFKLATGAPLQHVPYRGAAAALQDVVAGQIQLLFTAAPTAMSFIESGNLKLLATTGAERLPVADKAPTLVEAGYKDLVSAQWFGMLAPVKTPGPVVARLVELLSTALKTETTARKITGQGGFLKIGSPDDFARFIEAEIKTWGEVVRAAKIAT